MIDERERFERAFQQFQMTEPAWEILVDRRDRKRRNQRIAAGVVGITVFVAALWVVTSVGPLDRSEPSVVPGGDVTGPAETGPAQTGPTVYADTGWIEGPNPAYDLPPEGAVPSTPAEGKVVDEYRDGYNQSFVFVYADGRVISYTGGPPTQPLPPGPINERRLTPEGVELVRSGEILAEEFLNEIDLPPAHLWEDPEFKPFVPSRYAVCYPREGSEPADPTTLLRFFPARARAILLRAERTHVPRHPIGCTGQDEAPTFVVTTDEARELLDILGSMATPGGSPGAVRIEDSKGARISWDIRMMLPDGPPPCIGCF